MARPCTVCRHPQRAEIDQALVAGASFRDVAGRFGTSKSALERHRREHLSTAIARAYEEQAAAEATHGEALDALVCEQAARADRLFAEAERIMRAARRRKDPDTALAAIRAAAIALREGTRNQALRATLANAGEAKAREERLIALEEELRSLHHAV